MPPKPKMNYSADNMPEKDKCGTPPYALTPLLPYLWNAVYIWEPAAGDGLLADAIDTQLQQKVIRSDLQTGEDFFKQDLLFTYTSVHPFARKLIVTNPPFSLKEKWLAHCYELGYPFALLMPADSLFAAGMNEQLQQHGFEMIIMNPRVDFKMPNLGWSGHGAQMATAWFTWKLNIGQQLTFADISAEKKLFRESLKFQQEDQSASLTDVDSIPAGAGLHGDV